MVRKLLKAAKEAGFTFMVICEGEIDYEGKNVRDALEAIQAVHETVLYLRNEDGSTDSYAVIINELDPSEQIADCTCTGFVPNWLEENE